MRNTIQLLLSSLVLALWVVPDAKAATSITYTVGGVQVTLTDLGVVPSGTSSSGLAINNRSQVAGMANAMEPPVVRDFAFTLIRYGQPRRSVVTTAPPGVRMVRPV